MNENERINRSKKKKRKPISHLSLPLIPFALHGPVLVGNGPEFGEDLLDDSLKLLQSVDADLRHVVHHDVRIDPELFLRFFPGGEQSLFMRRVLRAPSHPRTGSFL